MELREIQSFMYVHFAFRSLIEDDDFPPSQFLFYYADIQADPHGGYVRSLWTRRLLFR